MKKQRMIVKIFKNGRMIDFERFSQKHVKTILQQYKTVKDTYFVQCYKAADKICFYSTPNDDDTDEEILVAEFTPEEFFLALE